MLLEIGFKLGSLLKSVLLESSVLSADPFNLFFYSKFYLFFLLFRSGLREIVKVV